MSIKGIILENGKVWLRKNERKEWELPGGKIDEGEQPEETVIRELNEELGFETEVVDVVQTYMYTIQKSVDEHHGVLVVTFLCKLIAKTSEFEFIGEAGKAEFQAFDLDKIPALNMPNFYKESIAKAASM